MSDSIAFGKLVGGLFSGAVSGLKLRFEAATRFAFDGAPPQTDVIDRNAQRKLHEHHDPATDLCYADTLFGDTILIVDPHHHQRDLRKWLTSNALRTGVMADLAQASHFIRSGTYQVGLVVVDLESCGGIANIVSELMAFRTAQYDIPLILISAESTVDDFSTERLAIADVTLRGPVSVSRLDLALAEAQINNQVWQARNATPLQ